MAQVFVSHSDEDDEGKEFLSALFKSVPHEARFYAWDGPRAPHVPTITENIRRSASLFVLLSRELEELHTAAWVSFEVGVAAALEKPVWVLEPIDGLNGRPVKVPVPFVTGYVERPEELEEKEIEPFFSLVSDAGVAVPIQPNGRPLRKVACLGNDCQASFYAYWEGEHFFCPVCKSDHNVR